MNIKVLGTGCKKCKELEQNVKKAMEEADISAEVEKIEDIKDIIKYGVMSTPALVVNEKVVSAGRLLKVHEIKKFL